MEDKVLTLAGLTRNESKVYLALLDLGSSLAGRIAMKSGIHRRSVYDLLDRLIEKGLVSYIVENNRKVYEASNPSHILDIMKNAQEDVEHILPSLVERFSSVKEKQTTVFYKGKEGIKTILADQLDSGKEILILGASPQAQQIIKYYFNKYDSVRIKKKINIRMMASQKLSYEVPLSEVKYLSGITSSTAINIYGNKVAIILWKEKPLGILINNEEIAKSFRFYFEIIWKIAKN